jgi:hypothetical protein
VGKLTTTIVTPELRDVLRDREDFFIVRDEAWSDTERYLEFMHPHAPYGRHVDVFFDENRLRFRPHEEV